MPSYSLLGGWKCHGCKKSMVQSEDHMHDLHQEEVDTGLVLQWNKVYPNGCLSFCRGWKISFAEFSWAGRRNDGFIPQVKSCSLHCAQWSGVPRRT